MDGELAEHLRNILRDAQALANPEEWEMANAKKGDPKYMGKYNERHHELFGVLVSLCDGDAKLILRGM